MLISASTAWRGRVSPTASAICSSSSCAPLYRARLVWRPAAVSWRRTTWWAWMCSMAMAKSGVMRSTVLTRLAIGIPARWAGIGCLAHDTFQELQQGLGGVVVFDGHHADAPLGQHRLLHFVALRGEQIGDRLGHVRRR